MSRAGDITGRCGLAVGNGQRLMQQVSEASMKANSSLLCKKGKEKYSDAKTGAWMDLTDEDKSNSTLILDNGCKSDTLCWNLFSTMFSFYTIIKNVNRM